MATHVLAGRHMPRQCVRGPGRVAQKARAPLRQGTHIQRPRAGVRSVAPRAVARICGRGAPWGERSVAPTAHLTCVRSCV